jgi:hypothetical protein
MAINFSFSRTAMILFPCLLLTTSAFANPILTDLNSTAQAGDRGAYVGEAFTTGSTAMDLTSATVEIETALRGTPKLELEAANPNGTVGSTLFTFTYASDTYQDPFQVN